MARTSRKKNELESWDMLPFASIVLAARLLCCSQSRVRSLIGTGALSGSKLAGKAVVTTDSLKNLLDNPAPWKSGASPALAGANVAKDRAHA